MNHELFEWDFENITHIARHGVTPEEAESVFDSSTVFRWHEDWNGEARLVELGHTYSGRVLQVITVTRGSRIRIVSAYDPIKSVVREYIRQIGD